MDNVKKTILRIMKLFIIQFSLSSLTSQLILLPEVPASQTLCNMHNIQRNNIVSRETGTTCNVTQFMVNIFWTFWNKVWSSSANYNRSISNRTTAAADSNHCFPSRNVWIYRPTSEINFWFVITLFNVLQQTTVVKLRSICREDEIRTRK
jgi:hypothetical protein